MTGSAYNAMDVFVLCESLFKGRGLGKGGQSGPLLSGGWRMTGSASMRCTFCFGAKAYSKGRGLGKGGQSYFY